MNQIKKSQILKIKKNLTVCPVRLSQWETCLKRCSVENTCKWFDTIKPKLNDFSKEAPEEIYQREYWKELTINIAQAWISYE